MTRSSQDRYPVVSCQIALLHEYMKLPQQL